MLQPRGHISFWYIALIIVVVAGAFIVALISFSPEDSMVINAQCEEIMDRIPSGTSPANSVRPLLAHASQIQQRNTWSTQMIEGDMLVADIITTSPAYDYLYACMRTYFELSDNEMNDLWESITRYVFVEEWEEYMRNQ